MCHRLLPVVLAFCSSVSAADRPNIVWISCEDISSHLGCYGDANATTPNLDALAKQSVRYTRAFTVHGVCAPCRTGIITGMYPMSIGANHMRSKATLPDHVKCFPQYLKQAGYYCTNNSKTDYNFHWKQDEVWDESSRQAHWKNRTDKSQPFFAVFNLTMTHESRIWPKNWAQVVAGVPKNQLQNPDSIKVPKLYPDTADVRAAHARLLDIIMVMDTTVGRYLRELKDANLADNTIVIFWSDHGNGFPRAKRWIYDSGTLVPMMARVPKALRAKGQGTPGSVSNQLINLIDLGPTVLNLAGVKVPEHMAGQPFLGDDLPTPREYIHGARDRIDERFDMVRSVRDKRYRYVRNYNTWRPALQYIQYAETSVVRKEMRRLNAAGELHTESAQFLRAPRPAEELYDTQNDPFELHNLAGNSNHADTLSRLQKECDRWQVDVRDAHLVPEIMLDEKEQQLGSRWAILNTDGGVRRAENLNALAKLAQSSDASSAAKLLAASSSDDAAMRWWAITGLANQKAINGRALKIIQSATQDNSVAVRIAAARGLHTAGKTDQAVALLSDALSDDSDFVKHAAINELDEIGTAAAASKDAIKKMQQEMARQKKKGGYVGNIATHTLSQFAE